MSPSLPRSFSLLGVLVFLPVLYTAKSVCFLFSYGVAEVYSFITGTVCVFIPLFFVLVFVLE